jgi:hypothetical protein
MIGFVIPGGLMVTTAGDPANVCEPVDHVTLALNETSLSTFGSAVLAVN